MRYHRLYTGDMGETGSNSGYSQADTHLFDAVVGSKVAYSFNNCDANILGTQNLHGWIYEMEVYGPEAKTEEVEARD